jgi:hypothetical protein
MGRHPIVPLIRHRGSLYGAQAKDPGVDVDGCAAASVTGGSKRGATRPKLCDLSAGGRASRTEEWCWCENNNEKTEDEKQTRRAGTAAVQSSSVGSRLGLE